MERLFFACKPFPGVLTLGFRLLHQVEVVEVDPTSGTSEASKSSLTINEPKG